MKSLIRWIGMLSFFFLLFFGSSLATKNSSFQLKTSQAWAKKVSLQKKVSLDKKNKPQASVAVEKKGSLFFFSMYIFLLAIFVGFEIITKVPPTLHTPLMSGANAISGITIIGALHCLSTSFPFAKLLGFLALVFAVINVVGGFLVTDRMLKMFRK